MTKYKHNMKKKAEMRDCNNKFMRNDMFMMFSRRTCFVLGLHVVGYSKLYKSDKKKLGHF